jgi:hypothetical protein
MLCGHDLSSPYNLELEVIILRFINLVGSMALEKDQYGLYVSETTV